MFDFNTVNSSAITERVSALNAMSETGSAAVDETTIEIRDLAQMGFQHGELIQIANPSILKAVVRGTGTAYLFVCKSNKKDSADLYISQLIRQLTLCDAMGKETGVGGDDGMGHMIAQGSAVAAWKKHKNAAEAKKELFEKGANGALGAPKTIFVSARRVPLCLRYDNRTGGQRAGRATLYDFWFTNDKQQPIDAAGKVVEFNADGTVKTA